MAKELEQALRAEITRARLAESAAWAGIANMAAQHRLDEVEVSAGLVRKFRGEAAALERALRLMGVEP